MPMVRVRVHVECMCLCAFGCAHATESSSFHFCLVWDGVSLLFFPLCMLRLAGQWISQNSLVSTSSLRRRAGITDVHAAMPDFEFWGSEHRTSCLCDKHFTHWTLLSLSLSQSSRAIFAEGSLGADAKSQALSEGKTSRNHAEAERGSQRHPCIYSLNRYTLNVHLVLGFRLLPW